MITITVIGEESSSCRDKRVYEIAKDQALETGPDWQAKLIPCNSDEAKKEGKVGAPKDIAEWAGLDLPWDEIDELYKKDWTPELDALLNPAKERAEQEGWLMTPVLMIGEAENMVIHQGTTLPRVAVQGAVGLFFTSSYKRKPAEWDPTSMVQRDMEKEESKWYDELEQGLDKWYGWNVKYRDAMIRRFPTQLGHFFNLVGHCMKDEILTTRVKEYIHVATALATQSGPCIRWSIRMAVAAGCSKAEILEACWVTVFVCGGGAFARMIDVVAALEASGAKDYPDDL